MAKTVAIVGSTGAVGEEILKILEQRAFPLSKLRCFSSPRSVGKKVLFQGDEIEVEALSESCFEGVDIALFSAGSSISKEWARVAEKAGTIVVDNSSAFRMDDNVPLVVPEINADAIGPEHKIIANPNCTTILLLMPLAPIVRKYGLKRAVISTYQAASGAGRLAMEELKKQSAEVLEGQPIASEIFPAPIGFNLIPHCDVFLDNGFTREEMKVVHESRKILNMPELNLTVTAVRVPVLRAHSEAVNLELEKDFEVKDIQALMKESPGVRLLDHHAYGGYPMPILASGHDPVIVGRFRRDPSVDNGLAFFLSGDQLRKGAALNAVQIAELFVGADG